MKEFINADCMEVMKNYPDKFFDLAIVDPVYGGVTKGGYMTHNHGQHIGTGKANQKGYHASLWQQEKTSKEYFDELFRVSRNQIVWGGNYFVSSIQRDSQCWVVWDKMHPEGITFADCELAWTSFDKAARIFRFRWNGMIQGDMKEKEDRIHPSQKPVKLYEWCLRNFAEKGDKILDTHVGSGSSLIACHRLGFDYVGFEIDKVYYELAEKRIAEEAAQQTIWSYME